MLISFLFFFCLFTGIGMASSLWRNVLHLNKQLMGIIPCMGVGFIIFGASKIIEKRNHAPAE